MAIFGAIVWVVLAYLVADYAKKKKKRNFLFCFILSLLTSPLVGIIILLIIGKK